ncbi:iron-containing alcohol dehydrogenase [Pseudomonas moraviensis]|uniref:Glycerol dehydrogenase n=1 Tax=Pseudomonas atacamensis TaxID=2565368 RepID=A0ABQ5PHM5_9PSED|nr:MULTISPECIES: glycerol dehydrogenase [Pseudomonas]MXI48643.1 iron-containing alcohol dehydrogenase [Pseudomonas moraviensis]GLH42996.1 glycerol dehydrogenase [Pseudomonas atacamensis]GLH55500.1 glycerol dehydrogenase [Pseudomonas atacamensis]
MVKTMGFPGRYEQGPNALHQLGRVLNDMGRSRPLVLCDEFVARHLWPQVGAALQDQGLEPLHIEFPGECTRAAIAQLSEQALLHAPDTIIALGGGKTIDTAKGLAANLDVPIIVCPTIASSDAPTSRLIVLYDEEHKVVGVEFLKMNPAAVIVDTEVIVQAPARFFAAGIGDAISKKFEARQCYAAGGHNSFGTPPLHTALMLTNLVFDTLMQYGVPAYQAVCRHELTDDVERVIEGTVLISGVGFESGGLSLSHALVRGLTAIPAMASMLHGELVAFGTLVQMAVEARPVDEIEQVARLLHAVKLPVTFAELGQRTPLTTAQITILVDATLSAAYARNMQPPLTYQRLVEGLAAADSLGARLIRGCAKPPATL